LVPLPFLWHGEARKPQMLFSQANNSKLYKNLQCSKEKMAIFPHTCKNFAMIGRDKLKTIIVSYILISSETQAVDNRFIAKIDESKIVSHYANNCNIHF